MIRKKRSTNTNQMARKQETSTDSAESMSEAEIDYNLMESFPASDPPSWTLGVDPEKSRHEEFEGEKPSKDDPTHQTQSPPDLSRS